MSELRIEIDGDLAVEPESPVAETRPSVARAVSQWSKQLVDLSGRNRLLQFRYYKRSTLRLGPESDADDFAVAALLRGERAAFSELFADNNTFHEAMRNGRTIRKRAVEHEQEQGIHTLQLAWRFVTAQLADRQIAAPLFLSAARLEPQGRLEADFTLSRVDDSWELNPALVQLMTRSYGIELDADEIEDLLGDDQLEEVVQLITSSFGQLTQLVVDDQLALANLSYAKLPIVRDLESSESLVEEHALVAALTGDAEAIAKLQDETSAQNLNGADFQPDPHPRDEHLILDSDGSQSRAIDAVLRGRSVVISGPPGTGKSQTIANLIAALAARGKSVLFVAEKRAAIDAVTKRLREAHLSELILDMHEGQRTRRQTAQQLKDAMDKAARVTSPQMAENVRQLEQSRRALSDLSESLHLVHEPWNVSAYELQSALLGQPSDDRPSLQIPRAALQGLTPADRDAAGRDLADFFNLDGGRLVAEGDESWSAAFRAQRVTDQSTVDNAYELLDALVGSERQLASFRDELSALARAVGAPMPTLPQDTTPWLDALDDFREALAPFRPEAADANLEPIIAGMQPAAEGMFPRIRAQLLSGTYKSAVKQARELLPTGSAKVGVEQLLSSLQRLQAAQSRWRELNPDGAPPSKWSDTSAVREESAPLLERLGRLTNLAETQLNDQEWGDLATTLQSLSDSEFLPRLPRLHELRQALEQRGLGSVVNQLAEHGTAPEQVASHFHDAWQRAVLDRLVATDVHLQSFNPKLHQQALERFVQSDQKHIELGPPRVLRSWAEAVYRVLDEHPDQETTVRREANKKARHLSMRQLLSQAPDVLLALKPCWAMSPLVVPQILPREQLFDVVIFDEASQIPPADAVSSLLRGKQAVIAGDERQLPPTTFFERSEDVDEWDDDADVDEVGSSPLTDDVESVLGAVDSLLAGRSFLLEWHYRSRDERLIAFSNHFIYGNGLTTFPGALGDDCLRHLEAPFDPADAGSGASNSAEVRTVVDAVLEHAVLRPHESLGVIALGLKHAQRIEEAIDRERADRPELDEFFSESRSEPFFVKNIERVQGDERDAIVLTVGYGRTQHGRMRYNFGPINQQGGERRLNVAVTRAKRRLTMVSCFSHHDMDPDRLNREGPRLLREYIAYAASGGVELGSTSRDPEPLNAFERDVRRRLEARGITLEPKYGASGYRIDFAAMHPQQAGRPVLAIEADGDSYHSSVNARERDRLRQQHLERLGWRFHRVWSTAWFRKPEEEADRAEEAWNQAVAIADADAERRETPPPTDRAAPQPIVPTAPPPRPAAPPVPSPPARLRPVPWFIVSGEPISGYSNEELDHIVEWAQSDGLLRTQQELIRQIATAMGYSRVGHRIKAALEAAIARVERRQATPDSTNLASNDPYREEPAPDRGTSRPPRRRRR